MPSPRRDRGGRAPAPAGVRILTATSVEFDRAGQRTVRAVTPRNGLPEFTPYQYRGAGHDLTGDCQCGTPCMWSKEGAVMAYPILADAPDAELRRRSEHGRRKQREEARRELRRRQAERRTAIADAC